MLAGFLASGLAPSASSAQPSQTHPEHEQSRPPQSAPAPPSSQTHSPYHPNALSSNATNRYRATWGIDNMQVRRTASGTLVRFSYRVTDAERARTLGDKEATPHLVDLKRGVMLQVPVMEQIGPLRQTGTPVAGQEYWVVFSNKGDVVKAGDRVDVLIGTFHADGLPVE